MTTDREATIAAFLEGIGWHQAERSPLAGDASARRYERLRMRGGSVVLMDSPPGVGDDTADFVRIARHLRGIGLNAPKVLFAAIPQGLLLLEDFGEDTFARVLARAPQDEAMLCALASDVLVRLQSQTAPPGLSDFSVLDWADAAMMSLDWYAFAATGARVDPKPLRQALAEVLHAHADGPCVMILRDYHAENLMWLPDRAGLLRAGLLDFQMAQMGQPAYDLVSLLQDARRDVTDKTEAATIAHFCAATETDPVQFHLGYAALGVQRALRILGIFARLCVVAGKPGYLAHVPRVWQHLQKDLALLDLAPLSDLCNSLLPAPNTAVLEEIARKCALHAQP